MIIYYIRHGDPNYELDCLTELGKKQAEALSKRLVKLHFDEIYVSPLGRAKETAKPTLEKLGMEATVLDFVGEDKSWKYFARKHDGEHMSWPYQCPEMFKYLNSPKIIALGNDWYKDEKLLPFNYEEGILYFKERVHKFMSNQGYEWDEDSNAYKCVKQNDKRIAIFAHEGNSRAFISALLNIPYPFPGLHYEFGHTCMIKIEMRPVGGDQNYCVPIIYSSAGNEHLYAEDVDMYFDYHV